jgi:hypothetical protein
LRPGDEDRIRLDRRPVVGWVNAAQKRDHGVSPLIVVWTPSLEE